MVQEEPVVARAAAVAILQLLPYDDAHLAVQQWLACIDAENEPHPGASIVSLVGERGVPPGAR
jgi:hypothetical protein